MVYIHFYTGTRLGNWLFQYAFAKSVSEDGVVSFYFDSPDAKKRLDPYWDLFAGCTAAFSLPAGTVQISEETVRQKGLLFCKSQKNVELCGVFQNPLWFDDRIVRATYKIPHAVRDDIERRCGPVLARKNCVSIHVRRGDYLRLPHRFPFVGARYLTAAVNRFGAEVTYVVCSDDLPWCKKFFNQRKFPGRHFYFVEGGSPLADLFTMSLCAHNICSNSTFSWWAAWLNPSIEKRVIMPARWFGVDIKQDTTSLYFKGVEVISNPPTLLMALRVYLRETRAKLGSAMRKVVRHA